MAKHLLLLRHGEAVPHGARQDSDRELTPKGERQARVAGRALARAGTEVAACYTSPKVRARDTARLACEELGVAYEEASSVAAGFDREDAEELLLAHDEGARVLVVGHEPDLSEVVHAFTGAYVDFKKGAVAVVKVTGRGRGELTAMLRPDDLEAMAG